MPVPEGKIVFQPFHNVSGLYTGGQFTIAGKTFLFGKLTEISGAFARLFFYRP